MDYSSKFWDWFAERYSKQPIADEAAYQKKLQVTREYLRPEMEVLEFGCGTGSTAIAHAPYVKRIRAIDTSSKMIEIAKGKADEAGVDNVSFEQAAVEEISSDQSLDAVLGLNILHLLGNKEEVIGKVHALLRPGGVFVSSTHCLGDTPNFIRLLAPLGGFFGWLPAVKVFTTKELQDSLTDVDFEIDHQWQPGKGKGVFIVAKKAAMTR
jgi:2-polyprenyl-3-methyl-5-hydroxy-6-metoxy-1,4-benzoquinol methylase